MNPGKIVPDLAPPAPTVHAGAAPEGGMWLPASAGEAAAGLRELNAAGRTVRIVGAGSKSSSSRNASITVHWEFADHRGDPVVQPSIAFVVAQVRDRSDSL